MQVFIIGSPYETAKVLDKKRLNKQIIECKQIISAINSKTKAWRNHPCTIQYRNHLKWLIGYELCLRSYMRGDDAQALIASAYANIERPKFHTQEYFDNMKRRLYTKNHEHYKQFAHLGESYENWYWVDNKWKIYKQE
jgi:hypothetical protein